MRHFYLPVIATLCLFIAACSSTNNKAEGTPAVLSPDGVRWLTTLNYPDDDRDVDRRLAALRLGMNEQAAAVGDLAKHLHGDPDPQVRAACAWSLGRLGGDESLNALINASGFPWREVRLAVVEALAESRDPKAADTLAELIANDDEQVALAAWRVLEQRGQAPEVDWHGRSVAAAPVDGPDQVVHVDPLRGEDTAAGTAREPVKTVKKGLELLKPGGELRLAGVPRDYVREAVVVPAALSGLWNQPTRIVAWPGKPKPVIAPTVRRPLDAFDEEDKLRVAFEPKGAFHVLPGGSTKILSLVTGKDEMGPGTCRYDAGTSFLHINIGSRPRRGFIEVAFAEDALHVDGASHVVVEGIDAQFAPDTGLEAAGGMYVSFVNCRARYCDRHGMFFYYSPLGVVRGGGAEHCSYQGISVRSSPRTLVVDAVAAGNGKDGVLFLFDSDYCTVLNSRVTGNGRGVAFITGSDYGRVVGCSFGANRGKDFEIDPHSRPGCAL